MRLLLMRIDDRLLHAQVAVGWVGALSPDIVVVADDAVAAAADQARLLAMGLPPGVELIVSRVSETASMLLERSADEKKYILIVRNPFAALEILEAGLKVESVNVGGMHFGQGKTKLLPYLFIDGRDLGALRRIADRNVRLFAQDVPGNPSYEVPKLLKKGKIEEN